MGNQDAQEVTRFQEVPRNPQCCGAVMKKTMVGANTGTPRYQYICLKCGKQQRGEAIITKQTTPTGASNG